MSKGRILIVDDEPQICRVMRATLCTAGYVVADARSGEEAMEKLRTEKFDLVLLDVNLPGISGIQTCREIRVWSDVPVIMLTVRDSNQDTVAALDRRAPVSQAASPFPSALWSPARNACFPEVCPRR
jgi:two-component system KDP operon response regulator KdpE